MKAERRAEIDKEKEWILSAIARGAGIDARPSQTNAVVRHAAQELIDEGKLQLEKPAWGPQWVALS